MRVGETVKRQATRAGVLGSLASLLLWPLYAAFQEPLRVPFIGVLALGAASGACILVVTLSDVLLVQRSRHARAARLFDLCLGMLLFGPAALALASLAG